MRRREFITLLASAAAWPGATRAQQPGRMRRIGVLMNFAADDPAAQTRLIALLWSLHEWGWTDGRNARIDVRWGAGDAGRIRNFAEELIGFSPNSVAGNACNRLFTFGVARTERQTRDSILQRYQRTGYLEGQNLAIARLAGQDDRLPELAADLVRPQIA